MFPVVYAELKRVAHRRLLALGRRPSICTTELVHEAFIKLAEPGGGWEGRAHFFGAASRAMRQVLVDLARRHLAAKRGGGAQVFALTDADATLQIELEQILDLDAALDHLDSLDQRLRQVVELRFFGGMPEIEIARLLNVSPRTIERDWLKARMFLLRELESPTKAL